MVIADVNSTSSKAVAARKLVRLIKDVEITLPADFESSSEEEQQEILSECYEEQNDYDFGWEIDYEWGGDEGTHEILSKKEDQDEDQEEDQDQDEDQEDE